MYDLSDPNHPLHKEIHTGLIPASTGNVALSIQELQAQVYKLELDNSYMQLDIERLYDSVRELERINSRY